MDCDLFSFTYENLNGLKFNELQKLSSQYRVNKRWAKKGEIISKLLFLRDQEFKKRNLIPGDAENKNVDSQENMQWIDGNKIFSSDSIEIFKNDGTDRRLTYNVSNPAGDTRERRLTFNILKTEGNQKMTRDVNLEICDNIDRRLTYNADEMKGINQLQKNATETSKPKLNNDYCQEIASLQIGREDTTNFRNKKGKTSIEPKEQSVDNEKSNIDFQDVHNNTKVDGRVMGDFCNDTKKFTELNSPKAKMLTVPYSRIPSQSRKYAIKGLKCPYNTKVKPSQNEPAETTEKVVAENTLIKLGVNNIKIPQILKKQNQQPANKVTGTTKPATALENVSSTTKQASQKNELSGLSSTRRVQPRRKSKTEDNVLVTNLKSKRNLKFFSPTQSDMKSLNRFSDGNRCNLNIQIGSKIPKAKPLVETQKPLTAKKMPDFSKIHQKQFEQMDSILDYKRKREERAKKLFGIPQPSTLQMVNKGNMSSALFQFKSSQNEKENQLDKISRTIKKPLQTDVKQFRERPKRQDIVNRTECKSNIVTNVKEQNRKHLNGVRTNKRFELQMKFRKM